MIYTSLYNKEIEDFKNSINIEFLKNSSLLISGATGLIGSYLIDTLLFDKEFPITIYALSRDLKRANARFEKYKDDKRLNLIKCDLTENINFNNNVDYILHLASFSDAYNYAKYPVETMLTNFVGCNNLLKIAKNFNCKRFFYASSSEIYGTSNSPMVETNNGEVNCLDIRSCYNESKRASETLCISYNKEYGVDVIIGRFCRIYGPTMLANDSKALSQFMRNAINGEDIILKSKGEQLLSYLYVSDAVSGLLTLLEKGQTAECYNISEDKDLLSLKEIAEYVATLGGRKVIFNLPNEQESIGYSRVINAVLISDKIKALGFKTKVSLKDGIKHTLNHLKQTNFNIN